MTLKYQTIYKTVFFQFFDGQKYWTPAVDRQPRSPPGSLVELPRNIANEKSEIGGSGIGFSPTPESGNRFRLRLRLRCVRACERAKLRARDDSSVARAGRANLWGPSSVRRPGGSRDEKFEQ